MSSQDRTHSAAVSPDPPAGVDGQPDVEPDGQGATPPEADADATAALRGPADAGPARPAEAPSAPASPRPAPAAARPATPSGVAAPAGAAPGASSSPPTTVLPTGHGRPSRPTPPRPERSEPRPAGTRPQSRPAGRRRARLVLQRLDPWSVFLFSLVASICLGVVLLAAVAALYAVLSSLGVLSSLNGVLGEVAGSGSPDQVVEPFITGGRVLGATAVLAAVDVVLLTALATLGALLYNLCASLTGGIEVQLGERD